MHADLPLQNRNPWLGEIQPLPMLVISSVALLVMGVDSFPAFHKQDMYHLCLENGIHDYMVLLFKKC